VSWGKRSVGKGTTTVGFARCPTPVIKTAMTDIVHVPTSWGEAIDRLTILEIKVARLPTEAARIHATRELNLLIQIAAPAIARTEVCDLMAKLKALNQALWDIEDRIREHERAARFDASFIALARAVYHRNDERSAIKRELSLLLGSALIDEKSHQPY